MNNSSNTSNYRNQTEIIAGKHTYDHEREKYVKNNKQFVMSQNNERNLALNEGNPEQYGFEKNGDSRG